MYDWFLSRQAEVQSLENIIACSGGSRISQRGRHPQTGALTYYLAYFLPKTAENERNRTERGHASLERPLDPPMDNQEITYSSKVCLHYDWCHAQIDSHIAHIVIKL